MKKIYEVLHDLDIQFIEHKHKAVFTVEESKAVDRDIKEGQTKNLFLRNKKGNKHYLVIIASEKRADLKSLQLKLNESKLSFGSPERLMEHLGITPGSVSLCNLINNEKRDVIVIVDKDLWEGKSLACHPNTNDATIEIAQADVAKYLDWCGNELRIIEL